MKKWLSCIAILCFLTLAAEPPFVGAKIGGEWKLYVNGAFAPKDAAELRKNTDSIRGVKPKKITLNQNGVIDIVKAGGINAPPYGNPAILAGTLLADRDGKVLLGVGADWWLECFINGKSVYSTLKSGNNASPTAIDNHLILSEVKNGENQIVLYVRSGSAGWSAAIGLPELNAENLLRGLPKQKPAIAHGPWLSNPGVGRVTVNFTTNIPMTAGVDYRLAGTGKWTREMPLLGGQWRNDRPWHVVELEGLRENARYEYRTIRVPNPEEPGIEQVGKTFTFETFGRNPNDEYQVFFTSDTQFARDVKRQIFRDFRKNCNSDRAALFIAGGDISSTFEDFELEYLTDFIDLITAGTTVSQPLAIVRGNHEYRGKDTNAFFRNMASENGKSYRAFRKGGVCFIILDSGEDKPRNAAKAPYTARTFDTPLMVEQRKWLEQYVKTDEFLSARFRIVIAHSAPEQESYMRKNIAIITDGIFTGKNPAHKLHLWIAGHTHYYLRSALPGSRKHYRFRDKSPLEFPPLPFAVLVNEGPRGGGPDVSGLCMNVRSGELEIKAMETNGKVFDHFAVKPDGTIREISTIVPLREK